MVSSCAGRSGDVRRPCTHTHILEASACPPKPSSPVVLSSKPMLDVKNFTIFIKNSIRFPLFNVTRWVQAAQQMVVAHNQNLSFPIMNPTSSVSEGIFPPRWQPSRSRIAPTIQWITPSAPYSLWEMCWTILDRRSLTWLTRSSCLLVTFFKIYNTQLNWYRASEWLVVVFLNQGGEIGINIEWKCNLDWNIELCVPRYSFTRLDLPFAKNAVSKGYNFRYDPSPVNLWASFTKSAHRLLLSLPFNADLPNISRQTTGLNIGRFTKRLPSASTLWSLEMWVWSCWSLLKCHWRKGQICLFPQPLCVHQAGKFDTVPTLINLVAAFTSIGLVRGSVLERSEQKTSAASHLYSLLCLCLQGTVLCDLILLNFLKGAEQYKAKKFEEVRT